jgi:hypothetical protein
MVLMKGDIAFNSFNADEDGWSIATFVDIDPNSIVYFTDNEATSSSAFNSGESYFQWNTGTNPITAGTVIRFSAIDVAARAASIGTFSQVTVTGNTNTGISATADTIYAYLGSSATSPTVFLAGVSNDGTAGNTDLTNAGLTIGTNSILLNASADYGVYNGVRSGQASFANYKTLVNNVSNWTVDTTNGDYTTTVPNITNFTIGSGTSNAAPTIQENTATTFINLAATSSGAVSGVISDPTDPARTLGIDFTIADADTPIANLVVTATSTNPSVVTNGNLALTGTGATRNLKITPTGVGFANIAVNVSDGTNNTSYTINYAASAASATPSTTRFLTGTSDGSTAIAIDSNYMLIGDDENQVLRLYDRNNSGLPVAGFDFTTSLGLTDISGGIPREVDIEASTRIGNRIYWTGSQSNNDNGDSRVNRDRIFATDVSGTGASTTLTYVGRYNFLREDIIAWDANNVHGKGANYYGLAASAASGVSSKVTNGYNIEGLEMAPDNTTAYVAFRAPEVPPGTRTKALIVPVTNFTSLLSTSGGTQGSATFGAPIELDLGGRGIREIRKNTANQYLIIAGSAGDAGPAPNDTRLFSWTGNVNDAPIETGTFASGFNPEGIVALPSDSLTSSLTGTNLVQFISDDGAATVYGDGTASKDLGQNNFKKFRTDTVALTDASYTFSGSDRTSVIGTSLNDSITGNSGAKTLTGGAGNDRFIYNSIKDAGHTISDFTIGQDKIVLTNLLSSLGYSGTNPIGDYVQIVQGSSSNNCILQIDRDGLGGTAIFRPFIEIDNISAATMSNVNNFVF